MEAEQLHAERMAFESWARGAGQGGDLRWYWGDGGRYLNLLDQGAWQAWKARALIAEQVAAAPPEQGAK